MVSLKKKSLFFVVLFCFLLIVGCGKNVIDTVGEDIVDLTALKTKADFIISTRSPEEAQRNLIKLAPMFAKAISENKGFKDVLAFEVAKKFDGDNNVLYDMISDKMTNDGNKVESLIRNNIQLCNEGMFYDDLINSIPYLNISIPVHLEKFSTYDGPIYVIPMRYDIDDLEIEALPGYDKDGNVKMFPANTPPDFPVIVLGVNERIPRMVRKNSTENLKSVASTGRLKPLAIDDGQITHAEKLVGIDLVETLDPWYSGAPEVYCLYAVGENEWAIRQDYPTVNAVKYPYTFNMIIFYYPNTKSNMYWKLVLREEDFDWGNYINFSVTGGFTWENENFNIKGDFDVSKLITNQDDTYGETQVYFYHYKQKYMYIGKAYISLDYSEIVTEQ